MIIITLFYMFLSGVPWVFEHFFQAFLKNDPITVIVVVGAICFFGLGTVIVGLFISGIGSIITSIIAFLTAIITVTIPSLYRGLKKRLSTIGMSKSVSRILSVLIIAIII